MDFRYCILYMGAEIVKWGVEERCKHMHKLTSTEISTRFHTYYMVSCMHVDMYKYTHNNPVSLLGEAQTFPWLIGVMWSQFFTSYYLCTEAGKISKQSANMTQARKTPWSTCQPAYSVSKIARAHLQKALYMLLILHCPTFLLALTCIVTQILLFKMPPFTS